VSLRRDPLERLRAANPVPGPLPPDWSHLLAHLASGGLDGCERPTGRRRERPSLRPGHRRRLLLICGGGACATLAALVVAGVLVLSAGSSAPRSGSFFRALTFPVFAQPAIDVSFMRGDLQALVRSKADLHHVRAIPTPYGTGYVTTTHGGGKLCVAVPPRPPTGDVQFLGSCAATGQAAQLGLVASLSDPNAVEFLAVLPAGASDPVAHALDGAATPLPAPGGIAGVVEHSPTTITYRVGDQSVSLDIAPTGGDCTRPHTRCATFVSVGPPAVCSVIGNECTRGCALFVTGTFRRLQPGPGASGGFCSPPTLRPCTEYVAGATAPATTSTCEPLATRDHRLEGTTQPFERIRRPRRRH
jgi:hypothetical protein